MQRSNTKQQWFPERAKLDRRGAANVLGQRVAKLLVAAHQGDTDQAVELARQIVKAVQEIGGYCCYGNVSAWQIWLDLRLTLVALDDALARLGTLTALRVREELGDVVDVARQQLAQREAA